MKSKLPKDKQQPQPNNTPFFDKNADNNLVGDQNGNSFFTKPVQARLRVGQQDDAYENEANQVATDMFSKGSLSLPSQSAGSATTRAEPHKDRAEAQEGEINDAKGGGQSLPGDVTSHLEPAFN